MNKDGSTKKFMILALLIFIISAYSLFQLFLKSESVSIYEGTIISLTKNNDSTTILVDGSFQNIKVNNTSETIMRYMLLNNAKVNINQSNGSVDDLSIGNYIQIEGPSAFNTSYPTQGNADKVTLLSKISPEIIIKGEIIKVIPQSNSKDVSFLVRGEVTGYEKESEVYVSIPEKAYFPQGTDSILVIGNQVFVVIDGSLAKSYPMQGTASSIILLELNK